MKTVHRIALWTLPLLLMNACSDVPPAADLTQKPTQEVSPVLSERERQHIGKDIFSPIDHVSSLPKEVREELGEMADPGKPWSVGCVGPGPRKRLIMAGISDDRLAVYYEVGGIAYHRSVDVFSIEDGKTKFLGRANSGKEIRNLEELKNAVVAAKWIKNQPPAST